MNKFKLSLFAVIAAGLVGCGGGGGSKADSLDNSTHNEVVNVVQDNTTVVAGDESSNSENTTQNILADGLENESSTEDIESPAEEIVVVDTGTAPAQVYIPNTNTVVRNGNTIGNYFTLATLAMDLNKDGKNDVVKFRSAGYSNLYIEAWINNGNGTSFTNDTTKYFGAIGNQYNWAHDVKAVDLNDDGLLDIVPFAESFYAYEGVNSQTLPALIQRVDGSFEVTSNPLLYTAMLDGANIPFDIDGDGDADILHHNTVGLQDDPNLIGFNAPWGGDNHKAQHWDILENRSENGVAKYVEHANAFKNIPQNVGDLYGAFLQGIVPVDVNGDGKLDVVTGGSRWEFDSSIGGGFSQEKALMSVYINNGDFTFTFSNDAWLGNTPSAISQYRLYSADFDGDGDIIASNTGWDSGGFDGEPNFMLWNSNGKFYSDYGTSSTHNYMGFTHQSDIGDIDGDGDMDIVYFDLGGIDVKAAGNSVWARILTNEGAGNFASNTTSLGVRNINGFSLPYWTVSMSLADMNGDGKADMIVGDKSEFGADRVILNNGDGTFGFESETFFEPLW